MVAKKLLSVVIATTAVLSNAQSAVSQIPGVLEGDYNNDGIVNTPDYAVWKDFFGGEGILVNEGPLTGQPVGSLQYFLWKDNFGKTIDDVPPSFPPLFSAATLSGGTGIGPVLAIDLVRGDNSCPVLDANGEWQFSVSIIPDINMFTDRSDSPDQGIGGSTAIDLGLQINDEHGFVNTSVSNLAANVSGQLFENDPNWDGNTIDALGLSNPGISPYGGLVDSEGLDSWGHQIDAFLGTIYFNSDNGGQGFELFTFSAGRPAMDGNFGGLAIEIDVDGGYGGFYRLAQHLDVFSPTIFDYPDADDFFTYTVQVGDVNLDGLVDTTDLSILDSSLGSPGKWTDGDLTGEGMVDETDRTVLLAILVPEPLTTRLVLVSLATLALLQRSQPAVRDDPCDHIDPLRRNERTV